jgi:hypothetical protein
MFKTDNIKNSLELIMLNRPRIPLEFWTRLESNDVEFGKGTLKEGTPLYRLNLFREQESQITTSIDIYNYIPDHIIAMSYSSSQARIISEHRFTVEELANGLSYGSMGLSQTESMKERIKDLGLLFGDDASPKEILKCNNMEIRRFAIKRYGYERLKKDCKVKVIHKDNEYELFDLWFGGMRKQDMGRFLRMLDTSTGREYILQTPRGKRIGGIIVPIDSCKHALAWSFDLDPTQYNPDIEA